jgi:small multidrug resistance family-3 protein
MLRAMRATLLFLLAGLLEIGGGYLVWLWLRRGFHPGIGAAGFVALALYGVVPVLQAGGNPFGRIYAAYGATFIILSLLWGWAIDRHRPDLRDWLGTALCIVGAVVMMWPRAAAAP